MAALQLKEVNFKSLQALNMNQRLKAFNSNEGRKLYSMLTPTEFAELFPRYYQKALPDISGFMKALPTSYFAAKQKMYEQQMEQTVSGAKEGRQMGDLDPSVRTKIKRTYETLGDKDKYRPTAEEATAITKVQEGAIESSSAEAKVLQQLSPDKLSSIHIEKYTDPETHKEMYRYAPPKATPEQAEKALREGRAAGNTNLARNQSEAYRELRKEGFSDEAARGMITTLSGEALHNPKNFKPDYHADGSFAHNQHGIAAWSDDRARRIARDWPEAKGRMPEEMSVAEQTRALAWEMKTHPKEFNGAYERIKNGNLSAADASKVMTIDFEKPAHAEAEAGKRVERYLGNVNTATEAEKPLGPNNTYTKEQIEGMQKKMDTATSEADKQKYYTQLGEMHKANGDKPGAGAAPSDVNREYTVPSATSVSQKSDAKLSRVGESNQCVALSKHYAPQVGQAKKWKVNENGGSDIVPGSVVATTSYNDGSGGKMARQMPDHRSHYHTGIALTRPDKDGWMLILDQHAGKNGGRGVTRINIYNYNGERWGTVQGGEKPTEQTMRAVEDSKTVANKDQKALIDQHETLASTAKPEAGAPNVPKQPDDAQKETDQTKDKKTVSAEATQDKPIGIANEPTFKPGHETVSVNPTDVGKESKVTRTPDGASTASVPTAPAAPKNISFTLNKKSYLDEIEKKHPMVNAPLVGPGREGAWQQTMDGLKGIPHKVMKNGDVVITLPENDPRIAQVRQDMKDNNLDEKVFLQSKIEEEKKKEQAKVDTKPAAPTPAPVTPAPVSPIANEPTYTPPQTTTTVEQKSLDSAKQPQVTTTAPEKKAPEKKAESAPAAPPPPPPASPPPEQKKEEPKKETPPPAHAGGGKEKVDGGLSFADISPQRGDNTMVTDAGGNQFTMNRDKEVLQSSPRTDMVNIKPTSSAVIQSQAKVQQDIGPTPQAPQIPQAPATEQPPEQQTVMQGQRMSTKNDMQPNRTSNMVLELQDASRQTFKNPTAMRAFARSAFGETGDVLDGNKHSHYNNNVA